MATNNEARPRRGPVPSPYARLGLAPSASAAEIRRAYRRLVMRLHPDHAGAESVAEFLAIKAAYETILANPLTTTPSARNAPPAGRFVVYRPARPFRPIPPPRSSDWRERSTGWAGGRWYWEGLGANAVKRARRERTG